MENYRASGRVPPGSFLLYGALLLGGALLTAPVYTAIVTLLPWVKLRVVVIVFYAMGLGYVVGKVAIQAQIRNRFVVWLLALTTMSVAYYVSWGTQAFILFANELGLGPAYKLLGFETFKPQSILAWMQRLFTQGLWGVGRGKVSGWALVAAWVMEAGLLYCLSVKFAHRAYGYRPYCEDCNRWTNIENGIANLPVRSDDPAWDDVMRGELNAVRKLKLESYPDRFVRLDLATCPECLTQDYLSVTDVHVIKEGNETKQEEKAVIQFGRITRQQTEQLRAFASELQAAMELMEEDEIAEEERGSGVADVGSNA